MEHRRRPARDRLLERDLALLAALLLSAFFCHFIPPSHEQGCENRSTRLPRSICRLAHQLSRVTERPALVLTLVRASAIEKKRGGVIAEHPRNRWDGNYRFLPPFFFPPFFAILPP